MAALTRRTWANLRDEVLKRLGREGDSDSSSRVEHWLDAALRFVAFGWHHYDLDASDTAALAAGSTSVALPADAYIVIGVRLLESPSGDELGVLTPLAAPQILTRERATARPGRYARFGSSLHFDKKSDDDYTVETFYYREPATPDYAGSDTPDLDRSMDQVIAEAAVSLGQLGYWQPDLGGASRQTMMGYLAALPVPPTAAGGLRDEAARGGVDRPHGGAQG